MALVPRLKTIQNARIPGVAGARILTRFALSIFIAARWCFECAPWQTAKIVTHFGVEVWAWGGLIAVGGFDAGAQEKQNGQHQHVV